MKQGWEIKHLGDVCGFQNGFAFKSKTFKQSGIPVLRISNIQNDKIDLKKMVYIDPADYKENLSNYRVVKDDLLIAMSGATTGKIGFNHTDNIFFLNQRVGKFEPSNKLDKSYLYYFLSTKVEENLRISAGAAQPNLSTQQIKSFELPLPPLPEQKRIIVKLDQAFEAIDQAKANVERNLQNAQDLFQSELNKIFSQKGDGWFERELIELVDATCTLSYGIVQPGADYPDGLPVVRPTDLSKRIIDVDGLKRINPKLAEGYKRTTLKGNDLLLCVRGSTGVVSIAENELKGANVTRGIVPILFNPRFIEQRFGYYLLISPYIQAQIKAKTYGAALMQINIRDVRKLEVRFPSNSDQLTIIKQLDNLWVQTQTIEINYQQELHAIDELKKSILQKAFNGEL